MYRYHFCAFSFNSGVIFTNTPYRFHSFLYTGVCVRDNICSKDPPPINLWIPLAIFAIIMAERNLTKYPIFTDCLICVALVQLYRTTSLYKPIKQTLVFLGKHSMNIFLFHTFIFYFWFKEFIYASRNPIIIFVLLLSICLIISMGLEWIKKYTIGRL